MDLRRAHREKVFDAYMKERRQVLRYCGWDADGGECWIDPRSLMPRVTLAPDAPVVVDATSEGMPPLGANDRRRVVRASSMVGIFPAMVAALAMSGSNYGRKF
jgi:hypothetical protein